MEDMVDTNQTTLRISLTKWREAGCPILFYVVRYKPRDFIGDWIVYSNHIPTEQQVSPVRWSCWDHIDYVNFRRPLSHTNA